MTRKEKDRIYYLKNRDRIIARQKAYYAKNKDKVAEYYQKNKEAKTKYQRDYYNSRYKTDPIFKLKNDISGLIRLATKRKGYTKKCKTTDILGCSIEFFKEFIAEKFTEGMTWDNYGEWEFDHRTPISWAETEEEVRELNHYTNFQPKWRKDNIAKGNKFAD